MKRNIIIVTLFLVWVYFLTVISLSSGYYAEATDLTLDAITSRLSGDNKKADSLSVLAKHYRKKGQQMEKLFMFF